METNYEDISLTCKDCNTKFVFTTGEQQFYAEKGFTTGEQQFYAEKGFTNQPVRCPGCRKSRKQQRNNY
ncbi:MAG: cytochrome C551 [Clostridia bacterium]|nr:cytochrome C551 [Clostridia bacterium]